MAQVIPVDNKSSKSNLSKNNQPQRPPLFRKVNYILMTIGVIFLVVGYICLSGGGTESNTEFSEAIFDTRRLVVAPILLLTGLIIEIFAIMWHPRKKDNNQLAQ